MENSKDSLHDIIEKLNEVIKELKADVAFVKRHLPKHDIFTDEEFGKELDLSKRTRRYLRKSGQLPSFNIGRRVYYSLTQVVKHATERKTKTNQMTLF